MCQHRDRGWTVKFIIQGTRCVSGPVQSGFAVDTVQTFYVDAHSAEGACAIGRMIVTGVSGVEGKRYGKGLNTVHIVFNCYANEEKS